MMMMVTMMVNICDDDCDLVIKVILVKEVMSCDVSPVAMFGLHTYIHTNEHSKFLMFFFCAFP